VRALVARAADSGALALGATHALELAAGADMRLRCGPDGHAAASTAA
jgi:hypothetical protein